MATAGSFGRGATEECETVSNVDCVCTFLQVVHYHHQHPQFHHTSHRWVIPAQSKLYKLLCVVEMVRCGAQGAAAIHAAGLVHGDLKLANLLLPRSTIVAGPDMPLPGPARVADFGTARMSGEMGGRLQGTLGYIAVCI